MSNSERKAEARAAYIHIPFCRHHCGYCNFTVVAGRDELADTYLDALSRELAWLETPRPVDTLYVGGGTPTRLAPRHLARLLALLNRWHPCQAEHEYTFEANPSDITEELVVQLVGGGVNRVSLGVQSLSDHKLRVLERDHVGNDVVQAVARIRAAIDNISLDLIFAAPGESLDDWRRDLDQALELRPQHLSTYGLTFEKGTTFWNRLARQVLQEVDEETQRQMYELTIDTLVAAGYEHYEVSNFALPGYASRHNNTYWTGEPYYAAGAGAARFLNGHRQTNHRSTSRYIRWVQEGRSPVAEDEPLSLRQRAQEMFVFGLRRLEGLDLERFADHSGFTAESLFGVALAKHLQLGTLEREGARLRLTRFGLLVSDSLWPDFLG